MNTMNRNKLNTKARAIALWSDFTGSWTFFKFTTQGKIYERPGTVVVCHDFAQACKRAGEEQKDFKKIHSGFRTILNKEIPDNLREVSSWRSLAQTLYTHLTKT